MPNKKSQISSEFLLVLSITLIIFFAVITSSNKREDQINSLRTKLYARSTADILSGGINSAYLSGDGAVKDISLPSTLKDGTIYFIVIYPQSRVVLINYTVQGKDKQYTSTLITSNITGNLSKINSNVIIRNHNGVIVIEK